MRTEDWLGMKGVNMADKMLIDGLIKFCDEKSKNIKLKAEPQVFVEIKQALEEVKVLKEKSEPKKPIIHGLGQRYCPICKCGGADHFYCARCGQKLGWLAMKGEEYGR